MSFTNGKMTPLFPCYFSFFFFRQKNSSFFILLPFWLLTIWLLFVRTTSLSNMALETEHCICTLSCALQNERPVITYVKDSISCFVLNSHSFPTQLLPLISNLLLIKVDWLYWRRDFFAVFYCRQLQKKSIYSHEDVIMSPKQMRWKSQFSSACYRNAHLEGIF